MWDETVSVFRRRYSQLGLMVPSCNPGSHRLRWKHCKFEVDLGYYSDDLSLRKWGAGGCHSVAEYLPSMWEVLGSVLSTKQNKTKTSTQNGKRGEKK